MTAFVNHFVFEFKTGLRNSNLLLMNYLFPLAFYAILNANELGEFACSPNVEYAIDKMAHTG